MNNNKNYPKLIIFGAGNYGTEALQHFGKENIAYFCDNDSSRVDKEIKGITIISFEKLRDIYKSYVVLLAINKPKYWTVKFQLDSMGIDFVSYISVRESKMLMELPFDEFMEKGIFAVRCIETENCRLKSEVKKAEWKYDWIKRNNREIKEPSYEAIVFWDRPNSVEFYLVDSFEIAHFEPLCRALLLRGIQATVIAERPEDNAVGDYFDYDRAINILEEKRIPYKTYCNEDADVAVSTQFAWCLSKYSKSTKRVLLSYGVALKKSEAFQLKKETVEGFDYVFTHGDFYKRIISGYISRDYVIDVSYPRYVNKISYSRKDLLHQLGIDTEKKILVYCPTWDEYSSISQYAEAINCLREKYFVIAKPHHCTERLPDKCSDYKILQTCSDYVLPAAYDLSKAVELADAAVCDMKSGISTELPFLKKDVPLVLINCGDNYDGYYIDYRKFARAVETPSDLAIALEDVLELDSYIEARKEILRDLYSENVHAGIDRAVATCERIIMDNNSSPIVIPFLCVITGQACNLKCKDCGNFVPLMPEALKSYDVKEIIQNLKIIVDACEKIELLQIQGGEPLIYRELPSLIEYVGGEKKIKNVQLATNGMFTPSAKVLNALKKANVDVRISAYTISHGKAQKLKDVLDEYGIRNSFYSFAYGDDKWRFLGGKETRKTEDNDIVAGRFSTCAFRTCLTLDRDELSYCSRAANAHIVQNFDRNINDFVKVDNSADYSLRLRKYLTFPHFAEACRYCLGTVNTIDVEPGEQQE